MKPVKAGRDQKPSVRPEGLKPNSKGTATPKTERLSGELTRKGITDGATSRRRRRGQLDKAEHAGRGAANWAEVEALEKRSRVERGL
ncbi:MULTISPECIES: hypothetical protein [Bradyrhizobium]|uniref:hypothetical protein n=1 Tax=Bradyrhizobium TaxID=374 RepID=UPI0011787498|nr:MULTISPECIES: hypothetical protein [Bradyrhizobium]